MPDTLAARVLAGLAATACVAALAACAPAAGETATTVRVWRHAGTAAEQRVFTEQVRAFNSSQHQVEVVVRTIPEGDYNDALQAAAAGDTLPDVVEIDGPQLASYVYQDRLAPLDDLVPAEVLDDQLPSLQSQDTVAGHTYAVATFDSGLGLYADRSRLRAAGVTWPHGIDDAWTAHEFTSALRRLAATDPDGKVLDARLDYGVGEWMTYGFAPLVASAGGDLIDPQTRQATGHLDGPAARKALRTVAGWSSYVDPDRGGDAFVRRRVALSWGGHWVYGDYARALGHDLVVLPLPDLGSGTKTGQGSWAWAVSERSEHQPAAAQLLRYLTREREVLRMTDANGAVPGTRAALAGSSLYDTDGPLRLFADQLLRSCGSTPQQAGCVAVPRPVTPGYPVLSSQFAQAVADAWHGHDGARELAGAASVVDADVAANEGYR